MTSGVEIWVLLDGRAGHDTQSIGLANAIGRQRPVAVRHINVALSGWARALPAPIAHALGCAVPRWPAAALSEGREVLVGPPPALVISTGRRAGLIAAGLRRRTGCKAIQILDPKLPASAFDALILPQHDEREGPNALHTLGALNTLTPQVIADQAAAWADRMPAPNGSRIAVLVGGPSKSADFTDADGAALLSALRDMTEEHSLLLTTSRRTPEALTKRLSADLAGKASVWTPDGDNPYPALLGHADAVLVTEDSVNMASEAATAGLPVTIFPIARVAPKFRAFHDDLQARGISRRFNGGVDVWEIEPLAEADRIAGDLIDRGVLPPDVVPHDPGGSGRA